MPVGMSVGSAPASAAMPLPTLLPLTAPAAASGPDPAAGVGAWKPVLATSVVPVVAGTCGRQHNAYAQQSGDRHSH